MSSSPVALAVQTTKTVRDTGVMMAELIRDTGGMMAMTPQINQFPYPKLGPKQQSNPT